jgi:cytochrome o ubiquinol oxidase subunit IV
MSQTNISSTGASQGSFWSYCIGFILSVLLTAIAFGLVISGALSGTALLLGIFGAAVAQIMVHLNCFLHLDTSSEARWNVLAIVFTVLILILFVGGTLWIMSNLDYRMM